MSDTESGCQIAAATAALQRGSDWHGGQKQIPGIVHCTALAQGSGTRSPPVRQRQRRQQLPQQRRAGDRQPQRLHLHGRAGGGVCHAVRRKGEVDTPALLQRHCVAQQRVQQAQPIPAVRSGAAALRDLEQHASCGHISQVRVQLRRAFVAEGRAVC